MIDLESLSLAELKALKKRVETAIEDFADREKRQKLAEIEAFARDRGMSLADVTALIGKKTRKPAAAKYANPADPSDTWTGRGRRPRWVVAAQEAGKSLDDLAI
jgi:DNA-binding protein H-NS